MNSTHIHLFLNHFPIIGTILGTLILLVGIVQQNRAVQKTAHLLLIAMALLAIPVFLTGEPVEESVENIPGISKTMIEEHEEAAEFSIWFMYTAGGCSLIALILLAYGKHLWRLATSGALVFGLIASVAMGRTGYLGGQIRHVELNKVQGYADPIQSVSEKAGNSDD